MPNFKFQKNKQNSNVKYWSLSYWRSGLGNSSLRNRTLPCRRDSLIFLLAFLALPLAGFGCKQGDLEALRQLKEPVVLQWWGVFDDTDSLKDIIASYRALHPNVAIEYRKLRFEEYEQALLKGWAEGKGPDILFIHNTWVGAYEPRLTPLPPALTLPQLIDPQKGVEKSAAEFRETRTLTAQDIKNNFVPPVRDDVVRNNAVYGLPLSVDTVVLFYNRQLLDQAKLTSPPATWSEVKDAVKALTIQNTDGALLQSGINLGGSANNNRAPDLLSLLMLQTGTTMVNPEGRATFNERLSLDGQAFSPGADALRFYTDFARPTKEVYTWNADLPEAQELFAAGRLGLFLGYAYQLPYLRAQGPKVDIGVAPVPHLNTDATDAGRKQVNFANYWIAAVAKQAENPAVAWDFVLFATRPEQATAYLDRVKRPPALRSLIPRYQNDPDLAPFTAQLFTAQTWYRGKQPAGMDAAFRAMIDAAVDGTRTPEDAVGFGAEQVNQTL